jgi:hypothetical protein
MKYLVALSMFALLAPGLVACDSAGKGASAPEGSSNPQSTAASSAAPAGSRPKDFEDGDEDANSDDDLVILNYGHAASAVETHAVAEVVKRFFAAAAADDGAKVCSLLFSRVAEEVPEEFEQASSPGALHGKTCAAITSQLFKRRHRQQAAESATLEITGVRVEGAKGLALLRFATTPEPHNIPIRREHGVWRLMELLDSGLP